MEQKTGIQAAVDQHDGSPSRLAGLIGDGVLRQHVEHWLKTGRVPPDRAPAVNKLTGVPLWDLRPDDWHLIWPELKKRKDAPKPQKAEA